MEFITGVKGLKPVYAEVLARMGVMTVDDYIRLYERKGLEGVHKELTKAAPGLPVDKLMIDAWYHECRKKVAWGPQLKPAQTHFVTEPEPAAPAVPSTDPTPIDERPTPRVIRPEELEEAVTIPSDTTRAEVEAEDQKPVEPPPVKEAPKVTVPEETPPVVQPPVETPPVVKARIVAPPVDDVPKPPPAQAQAPREPATELSLPERISALAKQTSNWIQANFLVLFVSLVAVIAVLLIALIIRWLSS